MQFQLEVSDDGTTWKWVDQKEGIVFLSSALAEQWIREGKKVLDDLGAHYKHYRVVEVLAKS